MGRKNVVKSYEMIAAGDLSGNITSNVVNVINMDKASVHLEWSGTGVDGLFTVEARNGEDDSWYTLDFNVNIPLDTDSGDHQILFNELPFTDIRLVYARTGGTGSVTATISLKVIGA